MSLLPTNCRLNASSSLKAGRANEIKELRNLTVADYKKLRDSRRTFQLKIPTGYNQLDNPMRIVEVKKTIARIKTF